MEDQIDAFASNAHDDAFDRTVNMVAARMSKQYGVVKPRVKAALTPLDKDNVEVTASVTFPKEFITVNEYMKRSDYTTALNEKLNTMFGSGADVRSAEAKRSPVETSLIA